MPEFYHSQRVSFVGGEGTVQNCEPKFGEWVYLIEMPLGIEPECGRVGAETMVIIDEADLCAG